MIQIKTAYQIKKIKEASAALSLVLRKVLQRIEPGVNPMELDLFARKEIAALGAEPSFLGYRGFPAALCISIDAVVIHGIPTDTPLRARQVVGVDCGVRLGAYYSDAARTVVVGGVATGAEGLATGAGASESAHAELVSIGERALYDGIAALKYGNRIGDYSQAVYSTAQRYGLGVIKEYCGHGVGLAIHEEPSIPNYPSVATRQRLSPGMVLAVEPMLSIGEPTVYVGGDKWSVIMRSGNAATHCEHTVLITEGDAEILTAWE